MPGDAGLFGSELRLVLGRRRTQGVLAVLAAVPVVLALAVRWASPTLPAQGPPLLDRVTENGLFVGVTGVLLCVPLLLPLAVSVVTGDAVAGEAAAGTLRYLLLVPVGRSRLLAVKLTASLVFAVLAALTPALVGALVGWAAFGARPAPLLSGDSVGAGGSLVRVLLVSGYVAVSLVGMVGIGLLASTLTDSPAAATASSVAVAVVSQVLGQLPQLGWLHPWLPTAAWFDVGDLLRTPIAWHSLVHNAVLQTGWAAVTLTAAWARFTSRDVTA